MNNPLKSLWYNLWVSTQSRQRNINRILKPYGVTHAQYIVMSYLLWAEDEISLSSLSQNRLAQLLSLDPMMISNILSLLEKKWLIKRKKSDHGLQTTGLALTKSGRSIIEEVSWEIEDFEEELFDLKDPKRFRKDLASIADYVVEFEEE